MDLRDMKTRRAITNAFLQLRKHKPLERITIKELAQLAEISKATFYLHYKDIYDLSQQLQNEVIENVLKGIGHPECFLTDPARLTYELFRGFYAQQTMTEILFAGNQSPVLPVRIDEALRDYIHRQFPQAGRELDMQLTYQFLGSYYVFGQYYKEYGLEPTLQFVAEMSEARNPMKHHQIRQ